MIPIVFINCSSAPFIDKIMNRSKVYETRSRNTLQNLVGKRVLLAETGKGKPLVRCSAVLSFAFPVKSFHEWDMFRNYTQVKPDSPFEWSETTKRKWLYELTDIRPVSPFVPEPGFRHGRIWMEYHKK